jgi:hypothetical protein
MERYSPVSFSIIALSWPMSEKLLHDKPDLALTRSFISFISRQLIALGSRGMSKIKGSKKTGF